MQKLKVGDRVKFLNDIGVGVIIKVGESTAIVEDESGFDNEYDLAELLPVVGEEEGEKRYGNNLPDMNEILARDISEEKQKKLQQAFDIKYANARATNQKRRGEFIEVDLHFHELVEDMSGLKDRTKLDIQLNHFERMMRIAAEQRIRQVIFIHGVGQGVLRHQIRSRLEMYYPECSVRDANPREYGSGATEVLLGQTFF